MPFPSQPNTQPIGYSSLWVDEPAGLSLCLIAPFFGSNGAIRAELKPNELAINNGNGALTLRSLDERERETLTRHPGRVSIVLVDCQSTIRASLRYSEPQGCFIEMASASAPYNEFMSRALSSGCMTISHRRLAGRLPEVESFARKSAVTLIDHESTFRVVAGAVDIKDAGAQSSISILSALVSRDPSLAPYMAAHNSGDNPITAAKCDHAPMESFAALSAFARGQIVKADGLAKIMGASVGFVSANLSGVGESLRPDLLEASDSVFMQSFADVHALSLIEAVHGTASARTCLDAVLKARISSKDIGRFSRAPHSWDTRDGLNLLHAEMQLTPPATGAQIWARSAWIASQSMAAWLQRNDVSNEVATKMAATAERLVANFSAINN